MKTQKLEILILFLCIFGFIGCDNEDEEGEKVIGYKEYTLTIASKKFPRVCGTDGFYYLSDVYAIKKENAQEWDSLRFIDGFEFEKGYEYKIKVSETNYLNHRKGQPAWTEYSLLEIISKDKKASDAVPLHFIPEWYYKDKFIPEYKYAVEADNKDLIEEDLKTYSIMPLDYHYLLYRGDNKLMTWIAIKDDSNMLTPTFIKSMNKTPEEFPGSYTILPPKGNIVGFMEWTFLDEYGNETNYPSFDVFFGYAADARSIQTPNTAYLYKDLTELYKNKYPKAGVKTVVISYAISF